MGNPVASLLAFLSLEGLNWRFTSVMVYLLVVYIKGLVSGNIRAGSEF